MESVNGIPITTSLPYAYVVQVLWQDNGKITERHYGPFESESMAMRWIVENMPERTLFAVLGLYRNV